MPAHGGKTGSTVLNAILARLQRLEDNRPNRRLSLDRGDTDKIATPYEGQVLIQFDTDLPWYFANGEWRPFIRPIDCFRLGVTGDITCPAGDITPVEFGTEYFTTGALFTTSDDQTFTLVPGIWQITVALTLQEIVSDTTNASSFFNIMNDVFVISTKQLWFGGISHTDGNWTFDKTASFDARIDTLELNVQVGNNEANDLIVRAAGDLSYLEAVRLVPAE